MLGDYFGEAKVSDPDMAIYVYEDIFRLDVSVDDITFMHVLEA